MTDTTQNIGIVGQGYVGIAIREKFRESFYVKAYDKFNDNLSITYCRSGDLIEAEPESIKSLVKYCNIIFICVPTPMFEDGECDTSIVESVIDEVAKEADFQDKKVIIVIKSTVSPGTTQRLNGISNNVGVVFSPEFLTEANSIEDFKNQTRIILGVDYVEYLEPVRDMFITCFPDADIICINSGEAEMTKYTTNLFLATKVSFFNDIYQLCQKLELNYDDVIEATMHDPRIGKSHYNVPGPDGDFGFGGHCLVKDLQAILKIADNFKLGLPTITGTHITNQIVRKNKDWMDMEGRAVTKRPVEETDIETPN